MEPFSGDREESTEDVSGRKHSRIKSLKTLFRRRKKTSKEANAKLSQSASDVTAGKRLGSDEDLVSFKGTMGSRALSHDSIFLDDQDLTDAEPARVLSQENVHGKIKALQTKLQLQKLHFGPPPLVLPIRSPEEPSSRLEDFSFHSSNDAPGEETFTKTSSQPCSPPISPTSKSASTKSPLPTPFSPFSVPTSSSTSAAELPSDFSSPAEFSASLDTSAARHRLSIKPRNQRASTKKKASCVTQPGSPLHILKTTDQFEFVEEQKEQLAAQEEGAEGTEKEKVDASQHLLLKSAQLPSVTSEAAPKVCSRQEHETSASQIHQIKPLRRVGTAPAKRPHSSFIESDVKGEARGAEETEGEMLNFSQHLSLKSAKLPSVTSEAAPKVSTQQEPKTVASQMVKPLRWVGTAPTKRPHSSFIESEIKDKSEGGLEIQATSDKKTEVSPEQLPTLSSVVASRPCFVQKQLHGEEDTTRGIKKSPPGSGSFPLPFSTVRSEEEERPRSGSFGELLEQIEAMSKTTRAPEKEKEEPKIKQLKGSPFAAERTKQEGSPSRAPAVLWDRKASLKKAEPARNVPQETAAGETEEMESTSKGSGILWDRKASLKKATPAKNVPPVRASLEAGEVESREELVDVAEEAKEEEEGKMAFGVKLRSTSLSLKFRSETSSSRCSKLSDDQWDDKTRQEAGDLTSRTPDNVPVNTACALHPKDPAPSGVALPVKHNNTLLTDGPPTTTTKVQAAPANNKEAETTPQQPQPPSSSSEVSWMSLAMEKTKSLQQLFTSRFPRDFTGLQTAARPQAQAQPKTQTETKTMTETMTGPQTQTDNVQQSSIQLSADAMKEELVQTSSQEQIVKPSAVAMQQKLTRIESQSSKQPIEGQFQSNTSQTTSQTVSQTASQTAQSVPWTTQSPLRSHSQTATTQGSTPQSFAPSSSGQHQPSWSNRGFQPATQIKSPAQTSESPETPVPSLDSSLNKESPSLFPRRTIWTGSVADRAAFLEKRAEWTAPPSFKGVDQRNPQTAVQMSSDTPISAKPPAASKDVVEEIRQGVKSEESSPIRVPEKPREDKWPRKNVESPSSPSSLLTRPSVLQSDSKQPTWMELAKRKSMAWSDKTMD